MIAGVGAFVIAIGAAFGIQIFGTQSLGATILTVFGGGTGASSFDRYPIVGNGGTNALTASSSPTAVTFNATSTSRASNFPLASTTQVSAVSLCLTGDSCKTSWPGSAGWPFTPTTNYGIPVQSTTTPIFDTLGFQASSTSYFTNASTTFLSSLTATWFPYLATPAGTFLAVDTQGKLIATTTPSSSGTNLSLIYSSTTVSDIATSSFTSIPASSYYQVELDVPARTVSGCALQFNGDTAANYGFRFTGGDDGDGVNAITIDKSTTQGIWLTFFTNNVAARQKVFRATGMTVPTGTTGGAPREDTGTWNNTSNQISSIQIGCGAALPSGTRILIYGNSNGS